LHLRLSCHWDQILMIEDPLTDPITHDFPCDGSHGESSSCPLSLDNAVLVHMNQAKRVRCQNA
jgi:hypothetical protein